jgi:hypothetical protein
MTEQQQVVSKVLEAIRADWEDRWVAGDPFVMKTVWGYVISLPYWGPGAPTQGFNPAIDLIAARFGINIQLRFTQVHYPFMDASILAGVLARDLGKDEDPASFPAVIRRIFRAVPVAERAELLAWVSLIEITVSGRGAMERVRPRQTVRMNIVGKRGALEQNAQATVKNRRGALTVEVAIFATQK